MELRKNTLDIKTNIDNSQSFKIKQSAKAFKILSDNLYSDKILAVVRELSCNAYDSHIAANNKAPFEIHLPNNHESYFSVKDYGTGMSHDQIMNLYTSYFDSDKTGSNDYIGALGLGSKSPFAYTDAFTVESIYDGVKRSYSCFIGEGGTPQITLMSESKTEDKSGTEVKLAVNSNDFNDFLVKTREAIKYFKTEPKVIGNNDYNAYSRKKIHLSGDGWKLLASNRYGGNSCVAIQGNVAYPIDSNSITDKTAEDKFILSNKFIIDFEIGDLDVAASREYLSYDKVTIEKIKENIRKTFQSFISILNINLNKNKNLWDAKLFLNDFYSIISNRDMIEEHVLYNDKMINLASVKIRLEHINNIKIIEYSSHYNGIRRKNHTENFYISPSKKTVFVINDRSVNIASRCKKLIEDRLADTVYLLSKVNRTFFNQLGNPKYKKAASLEAPIKEKKASLGISKNKFLKKINSSEKFSFEDILDNTIYYVESKRGVLKDSNDNKISISDVNNMLHYLFKLDIIPQKTEIYSIPFWAIKEKSFKQSNTVDFLEFFKKSITEISEKNKSKIIKFNKYNEMLYNFDWTINKIVMHEKLFDLIKNDNSKLLKMRKEINKIKSTVDKLSIIGSLINAMKLINLKIPENVEVQNTISILIDYPMLRAVDRYYVTDNIKTIFEYINLVDRS